MSSSDEEDENVTTDLLDFLKSQDNSSTLSSSDDESSDDDGHHHHHHVDVDNMNMSMLVGEDEDDDENDEDRLSNEEEEDDDDDEEDFLSEGKTSFMLKKNKKNTNTTNKKKDSGEGDSMEKDERKEEEEEKEEKRKKNKLPRRDGGSEKKKKKKMKKKIVNMLGLSMDFHDEEENVSDSDGDDDEDEGFDAELMNVLKKNRESADIETSKTTQENKTEQNTESGNDDDDDLDIIMSMEKERDSKERNEKKANESDDDEDESDDDENEEKEDKKKKIDPNIEYFDVLEVGEGDKKAVDEAMMLLNDNGKEICDVIRSDFRSGDWNALHFAMEFSNSFDLVKKLLNLGVDINFPTKTGCTVIHMACYKGNLEIFKYLKEKGADVYAKTRDDWTCLHYACLGGNLKLVKHLIEDLKLEVDEKSKRNGWTPLFISCLHGKKNLVSYLISKGADPNVREKGYLNSPLHCACFHGFYSIVRQLVEKGKASVDSRNKNNWTPLHFACRFDNYKIVYYLVTWKKARVNNKTKNGETPLHMACRCESYSIVLFLLAHKRVEKQPKNKKGETPKKLLGDNERILGLFEKRTKVLMAEEAHYRLKNEFYVEKRLKLAEMRKKGYLCDMEINGRENGKKKKIPCHRSVMERSVYVQEKNQKKEVIDINYDVKYIQLVIDWMYGMELKFKIDNKSVANVYKIAKLLKLGCLLKFLCEQVIKFLAKFKEENIVELLLDLKETDYLFCVVVDHVKSNKERFIENEKVEKTLLKRKKEKEYMSKIIEGNFEKNVGEFGKFEKETRISSLKCFIQHLRKICDYSKDFNLDIKSNYVKFKTLDSKEFTVHQEIIASSSEYFWDLFITKFSKHNLNAPGAISIRSHSIFVKAMLNYSYCKEIDTMDSLISLAILTNEYQLGSEKKFLGRLKKITKTGQFIEILLDYGHLFFSERQGQGCATKSKKPSAREKRKKEITKKIKKEVVKILKDSYNEQLLEKIVDKIIELKNKNSKMKKELDKKKK